MNLGVRHNYLQSYLNFYYKHVVKEKKPKKQEKSSSSDRRVGELNPWYKN